MSIEEIRRYVESNFAHILTQHADFTSPYVYFLPVPEDFDAQAEIQYVLQELHADNWLIFSTYGSFQQQNEDLFPILQIIREILFIDEDILIQNAQLPPNEQLPQVGSFLIPDFLVEIPHIDMLYKLMAKVLTKEETTTLFTDLGQKTAQCAEFTSDLQPKETAIHNMYQTILDVFNRVAMDLFQMDGMLFLYNDLHESDTISLEWLKYSACTPVPSLRPIVIICCFPASLSADFLQEWPPNARFSVLEGMASRENMAEIEELSGNPPNLSIQSSVFTQNRPTVHQFSDTLDDRSENEREEESENESDSSFNDEDPSAENSDLTAHLLADAPEHTEPEDSIDHLILESQFLYHYLVETGLIKVKPVNRDG